MPTYRGISQLEIVSSINDARALLDAHSTGHALEDHLHKVRDDALAAISSARSNAELAAAIHDSYVEANFVWIARLLCFHAGADTDSKGLAVYKNLAKWGVFDGARGLVMSDVDYEIERYINRQPDSIRTKADFNAAAVKDQTEALAPYKTYVIEIVGLKEGILPTHYAPIEVICDELSKKYGSNIDFRSMTVGAAGTNEDAPAGVVFVATAPIAVAIAGQYPAFKVKTAKGTLIPSAQTARRSLSGPGAQ